MYWMRCCTSFNYPHMTAHVFAISHYKPVEQGEDEFSKKILHFYLYGNYFDEIYSQISDMFAVHFVGDTIKYDTITLCPTSKKGETRNSMENLAKSLSETSGIEYKQVLARNRDIRKSHELKTAEERYENIKGSVDVTADVKGKAVIVIDNVVTTGYNCLEAMKSLLEKGASRVVFICLGLSIKERERDYYLDRDRKVSWLVGKFKSAKIPREERKRWKKQNIGEPHE